MRYSILYILDGETITERFRLLGDAEASAKLVAQRGKNVIIRDTRANTIVGSFRGR